VLFNSPEFFVFFAIVYVLYRLLGMRAQNRMLMIAGYVFYGWWDVRFLYLVIFSTTLDYCCGLLLGIGEVPWRDRLTCSIVLPLAAFVFVTIDWQAILATSPVQAPSPYVLGLPIDTSRLVPSYGWGLPILAGTIGLVVAANLVYLWLAQLSTEKRRKAALLVTVAANLIFLGFFKYFNFFIDSFRSAMLALGFHPSPLVLHIVLPVGISFYTFQSLSYTLDVYRGRMQPVRKLADFATFVAFFPQLVAGPIERASHFMPQLFRPRTLTYEQTTRGLFLILIGLFKKVAVADGIAASVNSIYNRVHGVSALDVGVATAAFAIQIYCDFSGYTDIARGVAKCLGFELMLNFNQPYFSRNPSEFWTRWHISLSSWLRDYLYIPLGGNRLGEWKTYRNLMLTMLLGGLWHGAAWNFILWGGYHGAILCFYRVLGRQDTGPRANEPVRPSGLWQALGIALFFVITCYGWLLFRAGSLEQVTAFTHSLLTFGGGTTFTMSRPTLAAMLGLSILIPYEFAQHFAGSPQFYRRLPRPIRGALYATFVLAILLGTSNEPTQFIYFQF
jgi:D-alanyl-lipoteichoic acid acyltransferase DltB (MBOAT superfamily)